MKMNTSEQESSMSEFEDNPEFNEELTLTELLRQGDYQAVERLIGKNPAMARKAFQNYRALKSLETIEAIEELSTHTTRSEATAKSSKYKDIKEIIISQVSEGVKVGLRLISGGEFINVPAVGATRGDSQKSVDDDAIYEVFTFSHFSVSKARQASAHESESIVFTLTIPQAQKVTVTITEKAGDKMIYQGKRISHLELELASGGYEINIDDEIWRMVLV